MLDNLHWLDVPEHIEYKVIILTRRCLVDTAPRYLAADCVPVSQMAQRCHLHYTAGHQLVVLSELVVFGRFPYSVHHCGSLYLDCCVTLATTLLAMDILSRHFFFLIVLVHRAHVLRGREWT